MVSEIPNSKIVDAKIRDALTSHPTKKDFNDAMKSKQDALTQSQTNAVNSGVTDELVEKLKNIENGAQKNPDLSPYAKKTELPVVPDMSKYALNERVESEEARAIIAERDINLKIESIKEKLDGIEEGAQKNVTPVPPAPENAGKAADAKAVYDDFKPKQSAVSSPYASGNAVEFIDTIKQDTNGKITATKKKVRTATIDLAGIVRFRRLSYGDRGILDAGWFPGTHTDSYGDVAASLATLNCATAMRVVGLPGEGDMIAPQLFRVNQVWWYPYEWYDLYIDLDTTEFSMAFDNWEHTFPFVIEVDRRDYYSHVNAHFILPNQDTAAEILGCSVNSPSQSPWNTLEPGYINRFECTYRQGSLVVKKYLMRKTGGSGSSSSSGYYSSYIPSEITSY